MEFEKLKQRWERDRIRRMEESEVRKKLLKEDARAVFRKYRITKAVLFGSTAQNRSRPESDIDLFVRPLGGDDYWNFIRELQDTVGLPVDVYTDSDDETFVKKILERGEIVYEL